MSAVNQNTCLYARVPQGVETEILWNALVNYCEPLDIVELPKNPRYSTHPVLIKYRDENEANSVKEAINSGQVVNWPEGLLVSPKQTKPRNSGFGKRQAPAYGPKVPTMPPPLHMLNNRCIYCDKLCTYFCSGCQARYCSIECQWADWPEHQISCKMAPVDNDDFGAGNRGASPFNKQLPTSVCSQPAYSQKRSAFPESMAATSMQNQQQPNMEKNNHENWQYEKDAGAELSCINVSKSDGRKNERDTGVIEDKSPTMFMKQTSHMGTSKNELYQNLSSDSHTEHKKVEMAHELTSAEIQSGGGSLLTLPEDYVCPNVNTVENADLGSIGSDVTVRVTMAGAPDVVGVTLADVKNEREFAAFELEMSKFGNSAAQNEFYKPACDDILLVSVEDGKWSRGHILQVLPNGITVLLIDQGKLENCIPLHKTRFIHPDFLKLPARAVICQLYGQKTADVACQFDFLQELYKNNATGTIRIISKDDDITVISVPSMLE